MVETFKLEARFYRGAAGIEKIPKTSVIKRFGANDRAEAIRASELMVREAAEEMPEDCTGAWYLLQKSHGAPLWSWWTDPTGNITKQECEYAP